MLSEPQAWPFADSHSVTKGKISYFMFKEDPDWIMLLTVAAVLQLYTSILIPRVSKKEKK